MRQTLLIIKPDAVERNLVGEIIRRAENGQFILKEIKRLRLSKERAQEFYAVHTGKPFYDDLVEYMISGPIVPMVLERYNAVAALRNLVGATKPSDARPGTIRRDLGVDHTRNSVHAADSDENAKREIEFFFPDFFSDNPS
jgi:nucleoside-diphosphate kinase